MLIRDEFEVEMGYRRRTGACHMIFGILSLCIGVAVVVLTFIPVKGRETLVAEAPSSMAFLTSPIYCGICFIGVALVFLCCVGTRMLIASLVVCGVFAILVAILEGGLCLYFTIVLASDYKFLGKGRAATEYGIVALMIGGLFIAFCELVVSSASLCVATCCSGMEPEPTVSFQTAGSQPTVSYQLSSGQTDSETNYK